MTRKIATLWLALILCMMYAVFVGAESRWMTEIKVSYSAVGSPGEGVFQLRGTREDPPMPEGAVGHRICVPAGKTRSFGEIVFPGPGVYIYEVNRRNKPEGITAQDASVYRVTMVVRSDGDVQQVIETNGEKVTEIRYEDRYEKARVFSARWRHCFVCGRIAENERRIACAPLSVRCFFLPCSQSVRACPHTVPPKIFG